MGIFDWFQRKVETSKKYLIRTKSGSRYEVERSEEGIWIINRGDKGKAKIATIGETSADDISELSKSFLGKNIFFYNSSGGLGNTNIITDIQKL